MIEYRLMPHRDDEGNIMAWGIHEVTFLEGVLHYVSPSPKFFEFGAQGYLTIRTKLRKLMKALDKTPIEYGRQAPHARSER